LGAALITGCTTIPYASPEEKEKALSLETSPDKATLFTIRGEKDGMSIHGLPFKVAGKEFSTIGNSFSKFTVSPGETVIETDMHQLIGSDDELPINLEAGKNYFFELSLHYRPLIGPRAEVVQLEEKEAMKQLKSLPYIYR